MAKTREPALEMSVVAIGWGNIRIKLDDGWVMIDEVRRTTALWVGVDAKISLLGVENRAWNEIQPLCHR